MMKQYYRENFQGDLQTFIGDSPVPYFGHAWSHNCRQQLSRVPGDRRAPFLICLYFTVLVDQAMYTHFQPHYAKFQSMTRYPKFCHGLSQFQHNPRGILSTPVEQGIVSAQAVRDLLAGGMAMFVDEAIDFFQTHMPEVHSQEFFNKLLYDPDVQIPELLVMVDPTLKEDVVCIAYKELRNAVDRTFGRAAV